MSSATINMWSHTRTQTPVATSPPPGLPPPTSPPTSSAPPCLPPTGHFDNYSSPSTRHWSRKKKIDEESLAPPTNATVKSLSTEGGMQCTMLEITCLRNTRAISLLMHDNIGARRKHLVVVFCMRTWLWTIGTRYFSFLILGIQLESVESCCLETVLSE